MRHTMANGLSGGNATVFPGGMSKREGPLRVHCQRDASGRITRKIETTAEQSLEYEYAYDAEGRLFRVFRDSLMTEQYAYTAAGQRLLRFNGWADGATKYYYDGNGCLQGVVSGFVTLRFTYDDAGNLMRCEENSLLNGAEETRITAYDYRDTRLRTVTLPDGTVISYRYDFKGRNPMGPVAKFRGKALVMEYVWKDVTKLSACYDYQTRLRYDFAYDGDALDRVRLRGQGSDVELLAGCDQVNTPKVFASKSGREVKVVAYDSFGNMADDSRPEIFIPIGFAGGLLDTDTGFIRFGFRDYDPSIGRFTCPDPAKDMRGDGDIYDYCIDDPVNMRDPDGLWTRETFSESSVNRDTHGQFAANGGVGSDTRGKGAVMSMGDRPLPAYPPNNYDDLPINEKLCALADALKADAGLMGQMDYLLKESERTGLEYGGWIVQNPSGGYSLHKILVGTPKDIDLGPRPPKAVGTVHTHPNRLISRPSRDDQEVAAQKRYKVDINIALSGAGDASYLDDKGEQFRCDGSINWFGKW